MFLVAMAAALLAGEPGQAGQSPSSTPLPARIEDAIHRPALQIPRLPSLPDPATHFRVTVEERLFPVETVLEAMRRDLAERPTFAAGPPGGATPIVGVEVLGLVMGLAHRIAEARRARAEAAAREEVEAELAAFCATHDCSVVEPGVSPREGVLIPPRPR